MTAFRIGAPKRGQPKPCVKRGHSEMCFLRTVSGIVWTVIKSEEKK